MFEQVILKQITELIKNKSICDPLQSGFRKGNSTATILPELKEDISRAMKKGEVTLVILADLFKAFDTVDYKVLLKGSVITSVFHGDFYYSSKTAC